MTHLLEAPSEVPLIIIVGEPSRFENHLDTLGQMGAVLFSRDLNSALRWVPGQRQQADGACEVEDLQLFPTQLLVRWRGERIDLTASEFRGLAELADAPGDVCTFEKLTKSVWNAPYFGDSTAIRSLIKRLRAKLADATGDLVIDSVRGIGFRLHRV